MSLVHTVIIAGVGPSACQYEWPEDVPILAVSSGYREVPRIDHFCTLDKVMCFPEWLTDSTRFTKHVPDWSNVDEWRRCPKVRTWAYQEAGEPSFRASDGPVSAGGLRKSNVDATRHNSLLFAVQLAPRLGFNRCIFIGVDLLGGLEVVSDLLLEWWPIAQAHSIEWRNASLLSTLCEWMPNADRMMEVAA